MFWKRPFPRCTPELSYRELRANDGNITIHGDGDATISGTVTLEFGAASAENTTFADGGDGTLRLDHSSSFTGTVSGFNHGDSLDLGKWGQI